MEIQIVIDTNVVASALRSSKGASYKLLSTIDSDIFDVNISTPLVLEYESVLKTDKRFSFLSSKEIDDLINFICLVSNKHQIFYLWRPFLKDPYDDLILELAVKSNSKYIVTYNKKDFKNVDKFGIKAVTPKEFLQLIGVIK
ncbi:putative toxin-antitoxin system toxin component, PIN family [bacterium]|nr:putative toxin-antitoxin system toxin component, PIN family [bacterium]